MTETAKIEALKPCPFCGGTDSYDNATMEPKAGFETFVSSAAVMAVRVSCACGASGRAFIERPDGYRLATEWWNSRILSPTTGDVSIQGAAADVLNERRRQVEAEGWTPKHDDTHSNGEMIEAAACYSITAGSVNLEPDGEFFRPSAWPWAPEWWKPSTPRRMLVKAAALLIAEIERLDRTALTKERQE